jgi:hypothetical protein
MTELQSLASEWLEAKNYEQKVIERRRQIEDRLRSLIGIADNLDGTETAKPDGFVIKVTGRIDRKVDADKLQELAAEHGLSSHLSSLFRWKPEINMAVWKATAPDITGPLAKAITAKPGRPSFSITKEKVE